MKDEEYIEMRREEKKHDKEKPIYALRKKDFIPFIGIKKHMDRCLSVSPLILSSEWYCSQCFAIDTALGLYNAAIVIGAGFGIERLVNFFQNN